MQWLLNSAFKGEQPHHMFDGKKILVTGATGSMGRTFVHRVLSGECGTPRKVVVECLGRIRSASLGAADEKDPDFKPAASTSAAGSREEDF